MGVEFAPAKSTRLLDGTPYCGQTLKRRGPAGYVQVECSEDGGIFFARGAARARRKLPVTQALTQNRSLSGDERRHLTVMFSDLVDWSRVAESLELEEQTSILREYRRLVEQVVVRFDGFIAQYLGDGMLVYFGYPLSHEHSAHRAVQAALDMLEVLRGLDDRWRERRGVRVRARVGIHAGPVLIGSERLAVGSTVNCAARVQALAQPDSVLVTESTQRATDSHFSYDALGGRELKGFSRPVNVFAVRGRSATRGRIGASQGRAAGPFVDREGERYALRERWARVHEGLQAALVSGESGIGKSRMLDEFRSEISGDLPKVLEARCSELHQSTALFPFVELMRAELGVSSAIPEPERSALFEASLPVREDLPQRVVALRVLLAGVEPSSEELPALPPHQLRHYLVETVVDWLLASATRRPTLLIVEDLHWADESTLEVCALLLARREQQGIMVALSGRELPESWCKDSQLLALSLASLSADDSERLCAALRGDRTLPASLEARIVSESAGVPLFVEEMTRDALELDEDSYAMREPVRLPISLRDSLRARLDRLGANKRLAQQAAVLGREFAAALLLVSFDLATESLESALAELVRVNVLLRRDDRGPGRYEFRHALIRNEAYESLAREDLRALHGGVLRALRGEFAELGERDPELLAYHCAGAGDLHAAALALLRAGRDALERGAFAEATRALTLALNWLAELPASTARDRLEVDVRAGLGLALISVKGFSVPEVEQVYARGLELCERLEDTPLRIRYGFWAYHMLRGDRSGTGRLLPAFARIASHDERTLPQLVANACIGSHAFFRADFAEAEHHLSVAESLCDVNDPRGQNAALWSEYGFEGLLYGSMFLGFISVYDGCFAEGRAHASRGVALAERSEHPYLLAMALGCAAPIAHELDEPARAAELAARLIELSNRNGLPYWLAVALCSKGLAEVLAGQSQGLAMIQQGTMMLQLMGAVLVYPYYLTFLARAQLLLGDHAGALATLEEALACTVEGLNESTRPELFRLKAEHALALGDAPRALAALDEMAELVRSPRKTLFALRLAATRARCRASLGEPISVEARDELMRLAQRVEPGTDRNAAEALLADQLRSITQ